MSDFRNKHAHQNERCRGRKYGGRQHISRNKIALLIHCFRFVRLCVAVSVVWLRSPVLRVLFCCSFSFALLFVQMLPKTVGSLDTLLLQLGHPAGGMVARVGGQATVAKALGQLQEMKLVFDTPARQMLLKKAITALANLQQTIFKLPSSGSGGEFNAGGARPAGAAGGASAAAPRAGGASSSSSSGLSGMALLNSPMPTIERATVVFDPANMRTGAAANPQDGGISRNIKPVNKMTFSSAESSASARLGVTGKCAVCGAHREVGSNFCGSCGKNANIVFE
jgi:hypothetical protein